MAISVKHAFQSAKADGPNSTLVQPSNWNAEHTITAAAGVVLGRNTSGAGAIQELPLAVDTTGNLSLPTGAGYAINGTSVLTATALGSGVVTSSLTSVGTITTGTWNATTIAVNRGGTGATSLTSGYLLKGNGTSAVSASVVYESGGNVGVGAASVTGYRLYLVGSTSDTTTYPLVIRNSSISSLFYIRADGLITAPPTYSATITSGVRDLQIDSGGTLGYVASIRATKTNIAALIDVSWLNQLQPRTFNFRKRDDEGNYTDEVEPELQYGLIAEEVEQVNPELVFYDQTENGPELRGVSYSKLVVPLLAKIQELETRLAALEAA